MILIYAYNEALMKAPFDDAEVWRHWPELSRRANAQAEGNLGFVDRYRGEDDPLGYIAPRWPMEPLIMGNLSAWVDLSSLFDYTFGSGTHGGMMKHRGKWFHPWPYNRPSFVAWRAHADIIGGKVVCDFDLDTAMLMQAELGRTGPTSQCFDWMGEPQ